MAKDWRPITQISLPGKLLERIIHTQLSSYLENNDILYTNQHGFRSDRSTSSAVFGTLKTLFENWNKGLISTCVFIDFARAFDSIDHNIFVKKLKLYGLSESSVSFMSSYIDSRSQSTIINGCVSTEAKLKCGTAQGSILGPLFFILYVNDIFSYVKYNNSLTMYADDTLLIEQSRTKLESVKACQETMDQVEHWCRLNRLTINVDKTKSMSVESKNVDSDSVPAVSIAAQPLQTVRKYEYLGVVMDDKLCMDGHIDHIIKKVQGKLCILRKFRRHITEQTALRIYKCLIMCHFDYGDFVVDSGSKANIDRLNRLQIRTLRCVEYRLDPIQRLCIEDLYHRYHLEPLDKRRKRNLLKILFKESKNECNIDMYRPERTLRSAKNVKLNHKFTRLTKIQQSPYYRGLHLWDELPQDMQKIDTKHEFKNRIKGYIL